MSRRFSSLSFTLFSQYVICSWGGTGGWGDSKFCTLHTQPTVRIKVHVHQSGSPIYRIIICYPCDQASLHSNQLLACYMHPNTANVTNSTYTLTRFSVHNYLIQRVPLGVASRGVFFRPESKAYSMVVHMLTFSMVEQFKQTSMALCFSVVNVYFNFGL